MSITFCRGCLEKQRRIYDLEEENRRLKAQLRYQERTAKEGFFGSSTPSSKVPVKPNSLAERQARRGGAKFGHKGNGRKAVSAAEADRVESVGVQKECPGCGAELEPKGFRPRTVIECEPVKIERILYLVERKRCPSCGRWLAAKPPGVLPKCLHGNQLLTNVAVQHYLHGVTFGSLERQLHFGHGSMTSSLHRIAEMFRPVCERLIGEYRKAPVKHADETGWRTDGKNGYAWLFCTENIRLFRVRQSRSRKEAIQVFGEDPIPGSLVVDRYAAYNKVPCRRIQNCYSHLLRDVQEVGKEFPNELEVQNFVESLAPELGHAMGLRRIKLPLREFKRRASRIKNNILDIVNHEANHPGIWDIQRIFRENRDRLYHWARDPSIPADNNLAERALRPLVIARKISFGSQSEAGAKTREILMTILHTLATRTHDVAASFKRALDKLAGNPTLDPYPLLFPPSAPSPPANN